MDGKQQLIDMIVSTNAEVIEGYEVVLDASSLVLSLPRVDNIDGMNTVVMATAVHAKVESNQVFYYNRLTQPLLLEGLGNPAILIPKDCITPVQLAAYFAATYDVDLDLGQVKTALRQSNRWIIKFFEWSYIWVGEHIFAAEEDPDHPILIQLTDILTNQQLDGLYYPDGINR